MTAREVARSLSVSHTVVNEYLKRARQLGIAYPDIEKMEAHTLAGLLQKRGAGRKPGRHLCPPPDWTHVHHELKKKSVTLSLLWQEYKEVHPEGYQLSQFSNLYRAWRQKLTVTMRQTHKAGEKMFADYAGQTVAIHDRESGKTKEAAIFVGVLGASNYTYSEASWDQSLPSWIGSHIHAFEYFRGVPKVIVPDNLKSGVSKACRYEPDLNPTYHEMAVHYGAAIIPARARKPRDKAKVEVGVQVVERWILAALRNRVFFSLRELNNAIWELLEKLNTKPFKKMNGSRHTWFETLDQPALIPLPTHAYVTSEWKKARVNIDYHVELGNHYYSVPYQLVGEEVQVRYTQATVEVFCKGKRVAGHRKDARPYQHTTTASHMPKSHQRYAEWTPIRIIEWARDAGESVARAVEIILAARPHPEQGFRSSLGVMRLGRRYGSDRLERACARAIAIGGVSYKSISSILANNLDQMPLAAGEKNPLPLWHANIRGGRYYDQVQTA
jgi:transposase